MGVNLGQAGGGNQQGGEQGRGGRHRRGRGRGWRWESIWPPRAMLPPPRAVPPSHRMCPRPAATCAPMPSPVDLQPCRYRSFRSRAAARSTPCWCCGAFLPSRRRSKHTPPLDFASSAQARAGWVGARGLSKARTAWQQASTAGVFSTAEASARNGFGLIEPCRGGGWMLEAVADPKTFLRLGHNSYVRLYID